MSYPMKRIFLATLLALVSLTGFSQTNAPAAAPETVPGKMDWFRDAKFGMFIHWGIYTELAGIYGDKTDGGEWMMHSKKIPIAEFPIMMPRKSIFFHWPVVATRMPRRMFSKLK